MYNVYINKKLLRIDKKSDSSFDMKVDYYGRNQLESIVIDLENEKFDSVLIIANNPESVLNDFSTIGEIRVASGGKVKNSKGDILFIYRNNVWDLPKGFVEIHESIEEGAIREIEEETNVSKLEIIDKLITTYHTYRYNGVLVLKISHWFNIKSDFEGKLVPQTEEGITAVKWLDQKEVEQALENTWVNIKLLF